MPGCNERVGRGTLTWPCTLDPNHDGPHYALESPGDRRRWEAQQREAADAVPLSHFQGKAQTTAERYTENPTPVPLSPGRRTLHRECKPWECYIYDGDQGTPGQRRSAKDECPTYDGSLPPTVGDPEKGTEVGKQTRTDPTDEVAFEGRVEEFMFRGCCGTRYTDRHNIECPHVREAVAKIEEEVTNRCGARHTLGHGDNAVCGLHRGHDGNHLDPNSSAGPYTWFAGTVTEVDATGRHEVVLDAPDPQVAAGEKIIAHGHFEIQPTKQREGDQRLPDGDRRKADVQSLVIADVTTRREVGIQRYGQALQTFNGRDTLLDLYEELLDATVYTRALLEMKDALRERLLEVVGNEIERYAEEGLDGTDTFAPRLAGRVVDRILDAVFLKQHG